MWRWRRTLCSQSLRSTSISQLPFESASNFVSLVSDTPSSKGSGEKSGRCVWQNAPFWNRGQIWENWEWQAGWFLFFSVYTSLLVNVSKNARAFIKRIKESWLLNKLTIFAHQIWCWNYFKGILQQQMILQLVSQLFLRSKWRTEPSSYLV